MPSAEVGTAHVTVYPQTDGKFGDTVGRQMQTGISAKSVAIGNVLSTALMKGIDVAASFLGDALSTAFNNAADYEQLIGGVETMFKDSSDIVEGYAAEAYRTAGLSANQYMEQVTSFSASLIQSVGGDTRKAAEDANMALMDMSDNANKMGTSMESIQDAYQGFAKQNYTMLDNLKLGYGGTKTEMERLLADAEKISGVHYDISSFDDVVQAIHVMQTEMGIAGTTAQESANTISGSLASLDAAWQNWLTGLATSDMDMSQLTEELVQAIQTALSNVVPAIGRIVGSLITMIAKAFGASDEDIQGFFDGIKTTFDAVVAWAQQYLVPAIQAIWEVVKTVVQAVAGLIQAAWPVISAVFSAVGTMIGNALTVITTVFGGIKAAVSGIVSVFTTMYNRAKTIFNNVKTAITNPIETAKNLIKKAIDKIKGFFSGLKIEIPKPKIPKVHVDGGEAPWGIAGKGRLPSFSVEWAARGGIVDGATLIGAGEAGPEAIVPLSGRNMLPFAQAIAEGMGGGGAVYNVYLNDVSVNDSAGVREITADYLLGLRRLAAI